MPESLGTAADRGAPATRPREHEWRGRTTKGGCVDEERPELPRRRPQPRPAEDGPTGAGASAGAREHSFAVEGELETLGRLAQGLRRLDGDQRRAGRLIPLVVAALVALALLL